MCCVLSLLGIEYSENYLTHRDTQKSTVYEYHRRNESFEMDILSDVIDKRSKLLPVWSRW